MDKPRRYTPQERYDATHTRREVVKLNLKSDADIIAALDASPLPKQTTIKRWIRIALGKITN